MGVGGVVWLRRSQYLLHSSDPVPGSHESLEHVPCRGRRAPRPSTGVSASGPSPQLMDDPNTHTDTHPPPPTGPGGAGWVASPSSRDVKGSKGVTVGDKGFAGRRVLMSIYSGQW